ncbi:MAG TPA: hypothetical protein DEP53_14115 [Bacteroidetes bacterium]|nr:hypothetical protein [Bacteroidota bacterium]
MELSDFQKRIVQSLLAGKSCHIVDFLKDDCGASGEKENHDLFKGVIFRPDETGFAFVVPKRNEAYALLQEYLALWHKLLKADLVIQIPYQKGITPGFYYEVEGGATRTVDLESRINATVDAYYLFALVPTSELKLFAENKHKTSEEIDLLDQAKDRKRTLSWTIALALFSIAVSVVTTYYNIKSYTTDRSVTITSQRASTDTTKVMLVMPNTVVKELPPQSTK